MPKVLQPLQRITNGDMTQAIISGVVDGRYLQQITWQAVWSAGAGTFSLEESLDFNPAVPASGTWLDNGTVITPASGSGAFRETLSNRAPCFYRLVFTPTTPGSNPGALNVYASGAGY